MTTRDEVVFLLDVDNTLLDNDYIEADLRSHLEHEFGPENRDRYWKTLEALRAELGYADYLGALQRYRLGDPNDPRLLLMSSFLVDYPFAKRLYPGALDVLEHLRAWGPTVILSDGDVVFQPRKVQRSGLWDAVEGRVLIYIHKEQMLDDVVQRYPARHYVMVDDKLRILAAMKGVLGNRLTTVFARQGHYALDPKIIAVYPPAQMTVERIGALADFQLSAFDAGPRAGGGSPERRADPVAAPGRFLDSIVPRPGPGLLTINAGSSSIRFAFFRAGEPLERGLSGTVDRIGRGDTTLSFHDPTDHRRATQSISVTDHHAAVLSLIDWLQAQTTFASVEAVGHRVVHGMEHTEPEPVTEELLEELHRFERYDPDHLPCEIELIEAFRRRHPKLPQVACFDTAFHRTMPRIAKLLPIPRRYGAKGVQRNGFHGLSYAYLMEELERLSGAEAAAARVILAHLGSGASMAAVRNGRALDTTMAFTPAAGLMMSTRSGDVDPGLVAFLARSEKMTAPQFDRMVNHESGLLGVSETSSDMRDLLARESADVRASEAVALFCYQAKKWIGAYAAALGGLDTLVFAGGIGENASPVRARICEGLDFLGIGLDEARNAAHAPVISADSSRATVRVIRTDEELMIARSVCQVLGLGSSTRAGEP